MEEYHSFSLQTVLLLTTQGLISATIRFCSHLKWRGLGGVGRIREGHLKERVLRADGFRRNIQKTNKKQTNRQTHQGMSTARWVVFLCFGWRKTISDAPYISPSGNNKIGKCNVKQVKSQTKPYTYIETKISLSWKQRWWSIRFSNFRNWSWFSVGFDGK